MYKIIRIDRNNLEKFPQNKYDLTDIDNPTLISEAPIMYEIIAQNRLNTDDFVVIVTGKDTNKYNLTDEEKGIFDSLELDYIDTNIIPDSFDQRFVHGNWGNITDLTKLLKIKLRESIENETIDGDSYDIYDQLADTDKLIGQINTLLTFSYPVIFQHMMTQDVIINALIGKIRETDATFLEGITDLNLAGEVIPQVWNETDDCFIKRLIVLASKYATGEITDRSYLFEDGEHAELAILGRKTKMAKLVDDKYLKVKKNLNL